MSRFTRTTHGECERCEAEESLTLKALPEYDGDPSRAWLCDGCLDDIADSADPYARHGVSRVDFR